MFERPVGSDLALLVHIDTEDARRKRLDSSVGTGAIDAAKAQQEQGMRLEARRAEFKELAESAGLEVTDLIIGKRRRPDPRLFVGKGKLDEIRMALSETKAELVLFGQRLSPSQERNLEAELKVRVLDRNSLILDIFAQRARSFDGKLQVELAQLQHLSTRLVRGWTHLERQKGGIGLRGPGETQLETDRRLLNERVKVLKGRLAKVRRQREQGRAQRGKSGIHTVALVGYTNAGKSSVLNRLTDAGVLAEDRLFATLDATTRKLSLPGGEKLFLTDTVGFVRKLPTQLVEAFKSTLDVVIDADLLLHVVDASAPDVQGNIDAVRRTLHAIGAQDVPEVMVFNKIDLNPDVDGLLARFPGAVAVSAKEGTGIDGVYEVLSDRLRAMTELVELTIPYDRGDVLAKVHREGQVLSESANDFGIVIRARLDPDSKGRLAEWLSGADTVPEAEPDPWD